MVIFDTQSDRDVFVLYHALAPIIQTSPGAGKNKNGYENAVAGRKMPVILRVVEKPVNSDGKNESADASGGPVKYERVNLPVVSGSGVRCPARDAFVRAVLDVLDLAEGGVVKIPGPKGYELAELLLKGGRNSAGEDAGDLSWEDLKRIYEEFPFFGLFGSFRVPGRLGVTFAVPLVSGLEGIPPALKEYKLPAGLVTDGVPGVSGVYMKAAGIDGKPSLGGVDDIIDFCRGVDAENGTDLAGALEKDRDATPEDSQELSTKYIKEYIGTLSEAVKNEILARLVKKLNVDSKKGKDDTLTKVCKKLKGLLRQQNIYEITDYIPAGTTLFSRLYLLPGPGGELMEACFDAYVEFVLARRTLGGLAGRGFGLVEAGAVMGDGTPFGEASRSKEFWDWLVENCLRIRADLLGWFREVTLG